MYIERIGYAGGNCDPVDAGQVSYYTESLGGWRERHTVTVVAASGYTFDHWELGLPQLGPDEQLDGDSLSAIQSQVNSATIVWDDPAYADSGNGIVFVAKMKQQEAATGQILYGKANLPIYGRNGTLLYKG